MAERAVEDINRHLDAVVPDGMRNGRGVRVWRELIDSLKAVIVDAVENALAAQEAADAAEAAQTTADDAVAQGVALDASLEALTIAFNDLVADYNNHIVFQATTTDVGHVLQADTPNPLTTLAAGPAPVAYDQNHSTDLNTRLEDVADRLDDLITKLQTAGVVV